MKVKVAKTAGFCMGVKRAMEIALEAAKADVRPIYTHGPLIHNPQALEMLEKKGISIMRDAASLQNGTVIIRAHGIAPDERAAIEAQGVKIADATCPHVLRVQVIIRKHVRKGYTCVIVGDKGHAEVVGLLGFAQGRGHVVETPADLDRLPLSDKMCVVAQTTQDRAFYEQVCARLSEKRPDICIFDTICDSTSQRQAEVLDLARQVDAMIVVGGRGSANTTRLVNISRNAGKPTFHVERASELNKDELKKYGTVGVTAGASTPTWLIDEVVDLVRAIPQTSLERVLGTMVWGFQLLLATCVYTAVGAACLSYAAAALMDIPSRSTYALIAAASVLGLHLLNRVMEDKPQQTDIPLLPMFYARHAIALSLVAVAGVACALAVAAVLGWVVLGLLGACCVAGVIYRLRVLPRPVAALLGHDRLEDIPGTKELFLSTAWTVVVILPAAVTEAGWRPSVFVAAAFVFLLAFLRILSLSVREIEWDAVVGRETIPTVFGLRATKTMAALSVVGLAAVLLAGARLDWTGPVAYALLGNVFYVCAYLFVYNRRWVTRAAFYEGLVDANFILAGLLAYLYVRLIE